MTFKEIEQAVVSRAELDERAPLHEQMCYSALRNLYVDYERGAVSGQTATQEKRRLRNAFERAATTAHTQDILRAEWQRGLKVSNEFRTRLHKALESGEGMDVLFPLACTCIAAMTGDRTLTGSEVQEKLKVMQLRMDGK